MENQESIHNWLTSIGLRHHVAAFTKNEVTLDLVQHLSDEDLQEIGIVNADDRALILRHGRSAVAFASSSFANPTFQSPDPLQAFGSTQFAATAPPAEDIGQWLSRIGMGAYAPVFQQNGIDISILVELNDDDLQEMQISNPSHRSHILERIRAESVGTGSYPTFTTSNDPLLSLGTTSFSAPASAAPATSSALIGSTLFVSSDTAPTSAPNQLRTHEVSPQSNEAPIGLGQRLIGRYYLMSTLGKGGMGVVYKAMDEVTRQEVAIKLVGEHLQANPAAVEALLQEAARAQQVAHPNLLRINHVESGTHPFIVMECVDGDTLTTIWREQRRKLDEGYLVPVLDQILEGLAYLHKRKLVHRDIKPDNILVSKGGEAKITDYGIATTLKEQFNSADAAGTLLYMAPEQIRGQPCDGRSDLYALGLLTFQMLTGTLPFSMESEHSVREWHLGGDRSLPQLPNGVLGDVVRRMIAVAPGDRFEDAETVLAALRRPRQTNDVSALSLFAAPPPAAPPAPSLPSVEETAFVVEQEFEELPRIGQSSNLRWILVALAAVGIGFWFISADDSDSPESLSPLAQNGSASTDVTVSQKQNIRPKIILPRSWQGTYTQSSWSQGRTLHVTESSILIQEANGTSNDRLSLSDGELKGNRVRLDCGTFQSRGSDVCTSGSLNNTGNQLQVQLQTDIASISGTWQRQEENHRAQQPSKAPGVSSDTSRVYVERHNARLRKKASTRSPVLEKLKVGTPCQVLSREDDWIQVKCTGSRKGGFAKVEFFTDEKPNVDELIEKAKTGETPGRQFTYLLRAYILDPARTDLLPDMKRLYVDSQFLVLESKRRTGSDAEEHTAFCANVDTNDDCLRAALEIGSKSFVSRRGRDFAIIEMTKGKFKAIEYFGKIAYDDETVVVEHKTKYSRPSDAFDWLFPK